MPPEPEMPADDKNGHVLAYRVDKLEKYVERSSEETIRWRRDVDDERSASREQMKTHTSTLESVVVEVNALKKTLLGFAITIAASSLIFAVSVLASSGRI